MYSLTQQLINLKSSYVILSYVLMVILSQIETLRTELEEKKKEIYGNLTPWQRVLLARHPSRPHSLDYIMALFTDWVELHGDRGFADDPAVVCGLAKYHGQPVTIIGQQKGRDTKENLRRNFGMMHPEGYRKALRIMKMADKFNLPIVIFIDTPGAYPGIGAEERGQAEAIAKNLLEMTVLKVPIIVTIIGEGASGGALGIGMGDRILMLENAWYSVISPEGCAAILWRDRKEAQRSAEALKLTAKDLLELQKKLLFRIHAGEAASDPFLYTALSLQAAGMKINHALDLAETQGKEALLAYMERLEKEAGSKGSSKAAHAVVFDPEYRRLRELLQRTGDENPKLDRIVEIVLVITKDDGRRLGDQLAGTRVIESSE